MTKGGGRGTAACAAWQCPPSPSARPMSPPVPPAPHVRGHPIPPTPALIPRPAERRGCGGSCYVCPHDGGARGVRPPAPFVPRAVASLCPRTCGGGPCTGPRPIAPLPLPLCCCCGGGGGVGRLGGQDTRICVFGRLCTAPPPSPSPDGGGRGVWGVTCRRDATGPRLQCPPPPTCVQSKCTEMGTPNTPSLPPSPHRRPPSASVAYPPHPQPTSKCCPPSALCRGGWAPDRHLNALRFEGGNRPAETDPRVPRGTLPPVSRGAHCPPPLLVAPVRPRGCP